MSEGGSSLSRPWLIGVTETMGGGTTDVWFPLYDTALNGKLYSAWGKVQNTFREDLAHKVTYGRH